MEAYRKVIYTSIIISIILIGFFVKIFFFPSKPEISKKPDQEIKEPVITNEKPLSTEEETDPLPEPELTEEKFSEEESDSKIRNILKSESKVTVPAAWLTEDFILKRIVAATSNISNGVNPVPHFKDLQPSKPFRIIRTAKELTLDPESYKRFNIYVQFICSIGTDKLAEAFLRSEHILDKAYLELGEDSVKFRTILKKAVSHLLRTPLIPGKIELEQKMMSFAYKSEKLEKLSAAQKLYLRTGSENIKRLNSFLIKFLRKLNISTKDLPQPEILTL